MHFSFTTAKCRRREAYTVDGTERAAQLQGMSIMAITGRRVLFLSGLPLTTTTTTIRSYKLLYSFGISQMDHVPVMVYLSSTPRTQSENLH